MYSVNDVANYTINYCIAQKNPISNLKLQKLLYFIWIDFFKSKKKYLFEENFYAWKFGPVVPEVYYNYCVYGSFPILSVVSKEEQLILEEDKNIIKRTIDRLKDVPVSRMIDITHEADKPWDITSKRGDNKLVIPFDSIIQFECLVR